MSVQVPSVVRAADIQLLASPLDAYSEAIKNTVDSLSGLAHQAVTPVPLPILLAVLSNQLDFAEAIGGSARISAQQFVNQVFKVLPGETVQAIGEFLRGEPLASSQTVVTAFSNFVQQSTGPIVYTTSAVAMDFAYNVERVFEAVVGFDSLAVLGAAISNPVYSLVLASGQAAQNVIDATKAGDFLGVIGQTIAAPAVVVDGFLNGTTLNGQFVSGLLSPITVGPLLTAGPIGALLYLRNSIASTLTPATSLATPAAATAKITAAPMVALSVAPATTSARFRTLPKNAPAAIATKPNTTAGTALKADTVRKDGPLAKLADRAALATAGSDAPGQHAAHGTTKPMKKSPPSVAAR
jgi:hypothetical protein